MLKLNHRLSRRTFVKSSVHLLVSVVAWQTVQAIRPAGSQVLAQASGPARAYGRGTYGQGAYAGNPCDQSDCEQQARLGKAVVSVYLPLVNK